MSTPLSQRHVRSTGRTVGAVALLLCLLALGAVLPPPTARTVAALALAVALGAAVTASVRSAGLDRLGWALIGAAAPLIGIGELSTTDLQAGAPLAMGTLGLVLVCMGVLCLGLRDAYDVFGMALQSSVIVCTGFIILWSTAEPAAVRWAGGPSTLSSVLCATNVVLVLLCVAHAGTGAWARPGAARLPMALLAAGLSSCAGAQVVQWRHRHVGSDSTCLAFLVPGLVLVVAAALVVAARGPDLEAGRALPRARLSYVLAATTIATILYVGFSPAGMDPTIGRSAAMMAALLVVSRLYEAHRARRVADAAAAQERHMRLLVAESHDVIIELDAEGRIAFASAALAGVLGMRPQDVVGRRIDSLVPDLTPDVLAEVPPGSQTPLRVESVLTAADGSLVHSESVVTPLPAGRLVALRDVTERVGLQTRLQQVTYHDASTGLPNRSGMERELRNRLYEAAAGDIVLVVLDVGLGELGRDGVRGDSHGDPLFAIGSVLRASTRAGDLVARISDHRFVLLLRSGTSAEAAVDEAQRVVTAVEGARLVADTEVHAAAGVCVGGTNAAELMRNAELALQEAQRAGGSRALLFEPAMLARYARTRDLRRRLSRTPTDDRWTLVYQPIINLETGAVSGAEALLRWTDPDGDFIGIEEIVRIAEETGAIVAIGRWVLDRAARKAREWQEAGLPTRMSVNVSTLQLAAPGFVEVVEATLTRHALEPDRLTLEITETAVLDRSSSTTATLTALRQLGVRVAIDDFGTGYAGLSNLRAMPLDVLKIDRTFVRGLGRGDSDEAVVNAVTHLGLELGLDITAEGVETVEQEQLARALGITYGQGYLYARPLSTHDIDDFIVARTRAIASMSTLSIHPSDLA